MRQSDRSPTAEGAPFSLAKTTKQRQGDRGGGGARARATAAHR
jgi:hypothetical protein